MMLNMFKLFLGPTVAWIAYPCVVIFGLMAQALMISFGLDLQIATYASITAGAFAITFLELKFPYRNEWLATMEDVANDAGFMVLVQILLPKFLTFFIVIQILRGAEANQLTLHGVWPHDFPVEVQAVFMLLIADFFRYWLHRAAHEWSIPLWRLHAVHHSPKKLYWLNVGRFHPIEKAMQYLLDALPFILIGASEQVLAIYFVFYAINGFFQHCNIEVRLGWLNYIISGPELHRWHHSRKIRESNNNYGNNLIIWDIIFGSYFFPKDSSVKELGLLNRGYPLNLFSQMKAPFIKGLDKTDE